MDGVEQHPLVLVIERDPDTSELYRYLLLLHACRVEGCGDGLAGYQRALAERPDAILTELALPQIDGIELCRRLRAQRSTRDIPVLVVTGYVSRVQFQAAREAGADEVLPKPCPPETIWSHLARLIASGRRRQA